MKKSETGENIARFLSDTFGNIAKTQTVIGERFTVGDLVIIPLIKVTMGFGAGSGGECDSGKPMPSCSAGGGGISVQPAGFLVINGTEVQLLNVGKKSSLEYIFESMPDLIGDISKAIKDAEADDTGKSGK
ncbi:MAG: GerW family sporulation protein [Firmicutes bacterium]|nr:GerW family sporulation protein [Bacillota bacterium]